MTSNPKKAEGFRLDSSQEKKRVRPFIVAEVGVNHEGSFKKAKHLIKSAAQAGADAVKFQTYTPARYASASDPDRLARVTRFSLTHEEFESLSRTAADSNIEFFSTPLTEDVAPLLGGICSRLKIASGDLTFEPVIRAAAQIGKPIILSTGLGTIEEIDQAIEWIRSETGSDWLVRNVTLMQCVVAYPTPIEEANLLSIPFLKERYGLSVGYSNHVIGQDACLAAVALGAEIIEVHFTDCKVNRDFRDHEMSFDEKDLREFVAKSQLIYSALGQYGKPRQDSEKPLLKAVRKGLAAARPLRKGSVIRRDDLMFARPATEFDSNELHLVVGQTLLQDLNTGELVPRDAVKNA